MAPEATPDEVLAARRFHLNVLTLHIELLGHTLTCFAEQMEIAQRQLTAAIAALDELRREADR